jgi:hypothetical protein
VCPIKATDKDASPTPNLSPTATGALCGPADSELPLSDYRTQPLAQIQQARPNISTEELYDVLEKSRNQLDTIFAQLIDRDRERSASASSASQRSSSSKRSREEDDESDRASKRALRRISLRNRTATFVETTSPASSSHGTKISFQIRIDTPPNTPRTQSFPETPDTEQQNGSEPGHEDSKDKAASQEEGESPSKEEVTPSVDSQAKEETAISAGQVEKVKGGKGRTKARARNA